MTLRDIENACCTLKHTWWWILAPTPLKKFQHHVRDDYDAIEEYGD